ncbi:MAG: PAS-domain containing protein, partial [Rhizobiales bacterium]|nr:PAS-domain containing protein [Hyphomicrobiales bacterium]
MFDFSSKFFSNTRIAYRISLIVVIGIALLAIIGGVYLYGHAKTNEQARIQENLHQLERLSNGIVKDIANIQVKSHDYLTAEKSSFLEGLKQPHNSLFRHFAALEPLLAKTALSGSIGILRQKAQTHGTLLEKIVAIQAILGVDENSGLRGKLRSAVHRVESELVKANQLQLTNKMLMMRRHEKDFIIRGGQHYVDELDQRIAEFKRLLGMASSIGDQKAEIYRRILSYQKHFKEYVIKTNGLKKQASQLDLVYQAMLSDIIEMSDFADRELIKSTSQVDALNLVINHTLMGLIGLALVLMSVTGLIIGRSIILPLKQISNISQALASNDTLIDIPDDKSQTEFGKINRALTIFRQHVIRLGQINSEMRQALTELQTKEMAIARQNKQFDTAISNVNQGLCLFDGDKKLIVSNDLYATLFGLSPSAIKPG